MHGIGDQQEYHAAVEQCEVAHHAKNRLLFCAFKLGVADKFGGSPNFVRAPVAMISATASHGV